MNERRRIRVISNEQLPYQHDCERMVRVLAERGLDASIEQVRQLWEQYSERSAAGWLMLEEEDDDLFRILRSGFTVDGDSE